MSLVWNPWHGCRRISEGCRNCYVFRIDARYGRRTTDISRTSSFSLPLKRRKSGAYQISGGETLYVSLSSDFFLEDADVWRAEAWGMMRLRSDITFYIITKRIERAATQLPPDWGSGYPNVVLASTVEDNRQAWQRLDVLAEIPAALKAIMCEPLLEKLDIGPYLERIRPIEVVVGGESGPEARECRYEWVLFLREQCAHTATRFRFRQTGAVFVKEGRTYRIPRSLQFSQATKAGIDLCPQGLA